MHTEKSDNSNVIIFFATLAIGVAIWLGCMAGGYAAAQPIEKNETAVCTCCTCGQE